MLVALLLGSGVLFGMAALAIDVGYMYAERTQLLSGADAAAVKVAQTCAAAGCTDASAAATATDYASDNANDAAAAASVCGRGGGLVTDCSPSSGGLTDCIGAAPEEPISYVEVHTSTLLSDGKTTVLPPVFAQAVLGGGFQGAEVKACARAAWGPPAMANGIALTISICDWKKDTGNGGAFPSAERDFPLYDGTVTAACGTGGTSATNPGGFRWLDNANSQCRAVVSMGVPYDVRPGTARPLGCPEGLNDLIDSPRPVLVPIFDSVSAGGGGSAQHRVHGFAVFVLTGWDLPGPGGAAGSGTTLSCSGGASHCIYGYFATGLVPGGSGIGGPDLGARTVARVG